MCRFLLLLITFHVMLSDITGMAPLILIYLIIILVPDLNLAKLNYHWMPCNVKMFGVLSIVVISMTSLVLLLIVCMVVLNNVYLYLNYTMITLLQVEMTMLAIIPIYPVLILNGGWLITDHAMGQFIMQ